MLRQYEADDLAPLAERLRQENQRALWLTWGITSTTYLLLLIVMLRQSGDISSSLAGMAYLIFYTIPFPLIVLERTHRSRRRRAVLQQVRQAFTQATDRSTLEHVLRIRAACRRSFVPDAETSQLASLCDMHLRRHLPRATETELQQLSAQARVGLVRLLAATLKSPLFKPGIAQTQISQQLQDLVVAILLTLATLKQPGAERLARRCLTNHQNEAFPEAAQEYLNSIAL